MELGHSFWQNGKTGVTWKLRRVRRRGAKGSKDENSACVYVSAGDRWKGGVKPLDKLTSSSW